MATNQTSHASESGPSTSRCRHTAYGEDMTDDSTFYKRQIRSKNRGDGSERQLKPYHLRMQPCDICFIYGLWKRIAEIRLVNRRSLSLSEAEMERLRLDSGAFTKGRDTVPNHLQGSNHTYEGGLVVGLDPPTVASDPITVKLKSGEFGEAYHILICRLLTTQTTVRIVYAPCQDRRAKELRADLEDLFHWYQGEADTGSQHSASDAAKKNTAVIITAAFKHANNQAPYTRGDQRGLFNHIRQSLSLLNLSMWRMIDGIQPGLDAMYDPLYDSKLSSNLGYFGADYSAKYWLNRYFRLTRQFGAVPNQGHRGEVDGTRSQNLAAGSRHQFQCMPKVYVTRLAIIYVRCGVESGSEVGRVMDYKNREHVIDSIAKANKLCECSAGDPSDGFTSPRPFTHVMFYGDFNYTEGCQFRRQAEDQLRKNKLEEVHVSFICRPWTTSTRVRQDNSDKPKKQASGKADPARVNPRDVDPADVDRFWESFRDTNIDPLPLQVKILGIWTALIRKYPNEVCVIGHRSGFIEAAALIGIPTFYLNNELAAPCDSGGEDKLRLGELLWKPSPPAHDNPHGNPEAESRKRLRSLSDELNTVIPVEVLRSTKDEKGILRVETGYEKQLTAAIFMYNCCVLSQDPLDCPQAVGSPVWTQRVRLMHKKEGRTWLRRKWDFAYDNYE